VRVFPAAKQFFSDGVFYGVPTTLNNTIHSVYCTECKLLSVRGITTDLLNNDKRHSKENNFEINKICDKNSKKKKKTSLKSQKNRINMQNTEIGR